MAFSFSDILEVTAVTLNHIYYVLGTAINMRSYRARFTGGKESVIS